MSILDCSFCEQPIRTENDDYCQPESGPFRGRTYHIECWKEIKYVSRRREVVNRTYGRIYTKPMEKAGV